jgi:hypothetical protein
MEATCKNCKEVYVGRRNQVYCSLKCKNEVNNANYRKSHEKLQNSTKVILNNAKILKRLYYALKNDPLPMRIFEDEGLKPAFSNHQRKDGLLEFDNWILEQVSKNNYVIHPPKDYKI